MTDTTGQWNPSDLWTQQKNILFMIKQQITKIATAAIVQVVDCTNAGGLSAVGTVTVQPLINQMTGAQIPIPHGKLFKVPYYRIQGGLNAIILDPQPGDIGLCIFTSRDSTIVRTNALGQGLALLKSFFSPSTKRQYDWSDGWYFGGFLNAMPTQFVQFNGNDINVLAISQINLTAPTVNINASSKFNVVSPDSEFSATIHTPGTITGDTDVIADGISGKGHTHSGVTAGSSDTGPPV